MFQQFAALTEAAPDRAALIDGATSARISRRDLFRRASEMASDLASAGLTTGDLVAVQLPNSTEFIAAWLASAAARLVFVPIDRDAPEVEVGQILSHFGVKGLVYRPDRAVAAINISVRAAQPSPLPSDARLIKLTSGSTGRPKGIVTSEANLIADFENIASSMHITGDDINLGAIPFSHSYGFSNLVSPLALQGTAVVISNDYLPQSIIALSNQ